MPSPFPEGTSDVYSSASSTLRTGGIISGLDSESLDPSSEELFALSSLEWGAVVAAATETFLRPFRIEESE